MGGFYSYMRGISKNFNHSNRAIRHIEKGEKMQQPARQQLRKQEVDDTIISKNAILDEHLKNVHVRSKFDNPTIGAKQRRLPEKRLAPEDPEFGFAETSNIPTGKLSFRLALEMLQKPTDTKGCTLETLAKEYNIDERDVYNIFRYFSLIELQYPDKGEKFNAILLGAPNLKQMAEAGLQKLIEEKEVQNPKQ